MNNDSSNTALTIFFLIIEIGLFTPALGWAAILIFKPNPRMARQIKLVFVTTFSAAVSGYITVYFSHPNAVFAPSLTQSLSAITAIAEYAMTKTGATLILSLLFIAGMIGIRCSFSLLTWYPTRRILATFSIISFWGAAIGFILISAQKYVATSQDWAALGFLAIAGLAFVAFLVWKVWTSSPKPYLTAFPEETGEED